MICVPCREKYYSDNKISADKYIPTKSDFSKNPCVFGSVSFRTTIVEKHSADSNAFHGLALTRKENLSREEEEGSQSDAQKNACFHQRGPEKQIENFIHKHVCPHVKRKALLRIRTLRHYGSCKRTGYWNNVFKSKNGDEIQCCYSTVRDDETPCIV